MLRGCIRAMSLIIQTALNLTTFFYTNDWNLDRYQHQNSININFAKYLLFLSHSQYHKEKSSRALVRVSIAQAAPMTCDTSINLFKDAKAWFLIQEI